MKHRVRRFGDLIDVFERVEKKYRLDQQQLDSVKAAISSSHMLDEYGETSVTSVYYDTPDYHLIERSLDKPLYKEKLRVRAYGALAGAALIQVFSSSGIMAAKNHCNATVFVELKKKFKGVVYKRRIAMTAAGAYEFLNGMDYSEAQCRWPLDDEQEHLCALSPKSIQISREIEAFMSRYERLTPSIAITCERSAYQPKEGVSDARAALRVTFDKNMCALDLRSNRTDWYPIENTEFALMEIKTTYPLDMQLTDLLSLEHIYPCSFSKYGRAYQLLLSAPNLMEGELCA